ncbi:MAG: Cytochrome c551 peroxidase [Bacteroidia bacterium]|nr:Cytochrome c551 peroxidase [Bacteroidia bacterium]
MKQLNLYFATALSAVLFLSACSSQPEQKQETAGTENEDAKIDAEIKPRLSAFAALPATAENPDNQISDAKVKLGHALYFDTRLSKAGKISCNSCHNLEAFGVDNLPTSPGDAGKNGDRNSPTVLNAALHTTQFWDSRAKDVEEQAGMPILNPVEMEIPNEAFLVKRLSEVPEYKKLFSEAFPGKGITYENLRLAIAAFERKLLTPSRFDNYLNGDTKALTLEEKKGLNNFIKIGCTTCHSGALLGGNMMQKFGVHREYWTLTESKKIDEGRAAVTKQESDKYMFKVPSLRNVEKTYPYFHDGSVADLKKAIQIMAVAQLAYRMSPEEINSVEAFLKSLTGDIPAEYKKAPAAL